MSQPAITPQTQTSPTEGPIVGLQLVPDDQGGGLRFSMKANLIDKAILAMTSAAREVGAVIRAIRFSSHDSLVNAELQFGGEHNKSLSPPQLQALTLSALETMTFLAHEGLEPLPAN